MAAKAGDDFFRIRLSPRPISHVFLSCLFGKRYGMSRNNGCSGLHIYHIDIASLTACDNKRAYGETVGTAVAVWRRNRMSADHIAVV